MEDATSPAAGPSSSNSRPAAALDAAAAVNAVSGVWDKTSGQLVADQVARWKVTKGWMRHASGLNNARYSTERTSVGTSMEANMKHISVTLATWDAVWEVYLDPNYAEGDG
ncbi:hypothetical protein HaLaN_09204, partial [Haematococcus lacustris]